MEPIILPSDVVHADTLDSLIHYIVKVMIIWMVRCDMTGFVRPGHIIVYVLLENIM